MDIVALAATLRLESDVSVLGYCYGGSLAWLAMQKSFFLKKVYAIMEVVFLNF